MYARTSHGISCLECCYKSLVKRRPKKQGMLENRPPKLELDGVDKDLPPLPAIWRLDIGKCVPLMTIGGPLGGSITPTELSGSFKPGSQGIGSENDQNLFGFF